MEADAPQGQRLQDVDTREKVGLTTAVGNVDDGDSESSSGGGGGEGESNAILTSSTKLVSEGGMSKRGAKASSSSSSDKLVSQVLRRYSMSSSEGSVERELEEVNMSDAAGMRVGGGGGAFTDSERKGPGQQEEEEEEEEEEGEEGEEEKRRASPPTLDLSCCLTLQERAFIPRIVRDQIATDRALPPVPCALPSRGAVLFADVSGFTALGESLRRMFVRRALAKPDGGEHSFGQHHRHIRESHHRQMTLQMMHMRRLDSNSSLGSLGSSHLQHHASVSVTGEAPMDVGMGGGSLRSDVSLGVPPPPPPPQPPPPLYPPTHTLYLSRCHV